MATSDIIAGSKKVISKGENEDRFSMQRAEIKDKIKKYISDIIAGSKKVISKGENEDRFSMQRAEIKADFEKYMQSAEIKVDFEKYKTLVSKSENKPYRGFNNREMYTYTASKGGMITLRDYKFESKKEKDYVEPTLEKKGITVEEYRKKKEHISGKPDAPYVIRYDQESGGYYMDVRFMNCIVRNTRVDFIDSQGLSFPMHSGIIKSLQIHNKLIGDHYIRAKNFVSTVEINDEYKEESVYLVCDRSNIKSKFEEDSYCLSHADFSTFSHDMLSLIKEGKPEFDLINNTYFDNIDESKLEKFGYSFSLISNFIYKTYINYDHSYEWNKLYILDELKVPSFMCDRYKQSIIGFTALAGNRLFFHDNKLRIYKIYNKQPLDKYKFLPCAPIDLYSITCIDMSSKAKIYAPKFTLEVNGKPMVCIIDLSLHTLPVDYQSDKITGMINEEYANTLGIKVDSSSKEYTIFDDYYICIPTDIIAMTPKSTNGIIKCVDMILHVLVSTIDSTESNVGDVQDAIYSTKSNIGNTPAVFISPSCFINGNATADISLDTRKDAETGKIFFHSSCLLEI